MSDVSPDKKPIAAGAGPSAINLDELKRAGKVFKENASASILDIGDRVGLIEFHTKANSLNPEICEMIMAACDQGATRFDALVIGNRGKHFCAGANLPSLLESARAGIWVDVEKTIRALQVANMALKYGPLPVVAAPFNSAVGGGCELCLHSARVVAAERTHMGLVETAVGLVPAGGGTKELAMRAHQQTAAEGIADPFRALQRSLQLIAYAKVSSSGTEAKQIFLAEPDTIVAIQEGPIDVAKKVALELVASGHRNRTPRTDIPVFGSAGISSLEARVGKMREACTITEHDATIAMHVVTILCGGAGNAGTATEQHFLDLEREAFLALLGTKKTQYRIEFLLKNNRPFRN